MTDFTILLLGNPEVLWRGQPVAIERRITRILLYYLASQGGMVNRSRLVNLFWGQMNEINARANMRQSLHRLRAAFPGTRLLKEKDELVGINLDEVDVDLHQFIHKFDLVYPAVNRLPTTRPLPDELFRKLLELEGLWHGTTFLGESVSSDSLEIEEWINGTNERLQPLRRWALERLSDHSLVSNQLQEALDFANKALINHENEESLHKRVLLILLQMNRSNDAAVYYKKIASSFAKEGLELSPEFRQQFGHFTNPPTRPSIASKVNWNIYSEIELPFVGRRSELELLNQQYMAGGAVFILGESGLGKTRLLKTFANQATPPPRTILARARAGESSLPYQPLLDAFRQGVNPAEWLRLPSVWASHLSQLLPELSALRSDIKLSPIITHEQARSLFQEALRQLFLMISQNQQTLLVLDDAQWSDKATLVALEYLISRPPFDKRALMVIAARVEEPNPVILRMQAHMVRVNSIKSIHLEQLQTAEISQLIQNTLHISTSSGFVERLARASGGNPLYIGEILTSMVAHTPNELDTEDLPTSENLTKLIQARLDLLPQATQRVLEAAAVLGNDFSLIDLSSTTRYLPEPLSMALSDLEESHLVQVNPSQNEIGKVRIRFIHDKFREVQLKMISPAILPSLHRQAAKALQASAGEKLDDSAAVIAQHYEHAGDCLEAFHMWVRAGNHSLNLFSTDEANFAFEKAAALIQNCGQGLEDEAIYDLFETWCDMWSALNATDVLTKIGTDLVAIGIARRSNLLCCGGHHRLGNAAFTVNDFQNGMRELNIALDYLQNLDFPKLNIRVYWELGVLQYLSGQIRAAEQSLRKALDYAGDAEAAEDKVLIWMGCIYYELGMLKTISGWPEQGNEFARRSLDLLQKAQDKNHLAPPSAMIDPYSLIGLTEHYMGRYPEAAKQLQETLELATQAKFWRATGYLHDYLAMNELTMGNLDETLFHAEQAIKIGEQLQRKEIHSLARLVMGDLLIKMQDFQSAHENFTLALQENQDTFLTPHFMLHLGYFDVMAGNTEAGYKQITQAEAICQDLGLGLIEADANIVYFFYYSKTGNWEACKERAIQCIHLCEERKLDHFKIFAEYFLGVSFIQTGEPEYGLQILQQAAQTAQSTQNLQAEVLIRQSITVFKKMTGQDPTIEVERLKVIFEHLDKHTQNPALRPLFLKLAEYLLQEPLIPGLFTEF